MLYNYSEVCLSGGFYEKLLFSQRPQVMKVLFVSPVTLNLGCYYISGVLEGTAENFHVKKRTYKGELADFDFGEQNVSFDRCYRFFGLHFHPDITKCPKLSYPDLRVAQTSLEDWEAYEHVDVRPVITVAHILEDDRIIAWLWSSNLKRCQ